MVTRHEFLARLHHLLTPRGYLEIGVQFGDSLKLASCPAVGIDPHPHVGREIPNAVIAPMTSDLYFRTHEPPFPVDLAFIDGSHLYEDALRDFMNIESHSNPKTVVVFDDVLPYNQEIASRNQPPGDWTGDVWKIIPVLANWRPDLDTMLVDVFPTGALVVWGLEDINLTLSLNYSNIVLPEMVDWTVPDEILFRTDAITADEAIDRLKGQL